MAKEKTLESIDAGSHPVFVFVDHNEDSIILRSIDEPSQHVVIDKTSLSLFASTFESLAKQFPSLR